MSEARKLLSKEELLNVFTALDAQLARRGRREMLVIGGGAAMAFLRDIRLTDDIDVLNFDVDAMPLETAESLSDVSEALGLTGEWFNSDASRFAYFADIGFSACQVFEGEHLTVLRPDNEHLLAMKLLAGRDKDLADAAWLAQDLQISDHEQMHSVVVDAYRGRPDLDDAVAWSKGFVGNVVDAMALQVHLALQQAEREIDGACVHRLDSSTCGKWMPRAKTAC